MLDSEMNSLRFHEADSAWIRSFSLQDVKCLVVCRGPVRHEAFQVFEEIGVREFGMLLSEKDSIVYPRCLAPEIRSIPWQQNIHRVRDYMGSGQEERLIRIQEIVDIARTHDYTHVFAGYGFMAEDADFVQAIEAAGLCFVGPSSSVIRRAGAKDEAKKLARSLGNAVIPGIDDISARALLERAGDRTALTALAADHHLGWTWSEDLSPAENAEVLLQAGYSTGTELVTIEDLQRQASIESEKIWVDYPGKRIRFKCIGGGGGKGQRVVSERSEIAGAVFEILAEQKVVEPGSNRNFLIELNLETTRHNEIQVIGNGEWALALGGRDCSLQMREQKQLEFSLTEELLDEAIPRYHGAQRETLERDKQTLRAMEHDSEVFGAGVGLDSVSTFECIVEDFDHFFMEMNTRIQVEHGVTELAYRLKFMNPDDPGECFYIERLIEAMVLVALHGKRLPKPERTPRHISGAEIRVNATNAALQPHAGGMIRYWSKPIAFEHRDDQGIGTRNPDTGSFMFYNLAGAYDSNIALVLSYGDNRAHNLERLSEIMRCTELRGVDLETSVPVQYGLINWTLGTEPMMKPNTRFLTHYLAAVGSLRIVARDFDLDLASTQLKQSADSAEAQAVLAAKETLLTRPLRNLLSDPHALAGFIGLHQGRLWDHAGDEVRFLANPVHILAELYHYLHMDFCPEKAASEMIWAEDNSILQDALDFYTHVARLTAVESWPEVEALFEAESNDAIAPADPMKWARFQAAHRGYQLGMDMLLVIPRIAARAAFDQITIDDQLKPVLPPQFEDPETLPELVRALAPPPTQSGTEIVTPMGGAFYGRETPQMPLLVDEGDHFDQGQPLFVIEVMKMFNKVLAPFAGTVTRNLMRDSDGAIVTKGQRIFEIEPDEIVVLESDEEIQERRRALTLALLQPGDQ